VGASRSPPPRPPPIGVSLAGLLGRSPPGRHSAREQQRFRGDELTDDSVRRRVTTLGKEGCPVRRDNARPGESGERGKRRGRRLRRGNLHDTVDRGLDGRTRPRPRCARVRAWFEVLTRPRRFFERGVAPGDQAPGLVFASVVVLVEEASRFAVVDLASRASSRRVRFRIRSSATWDRWSRCSRCWPSSSSSRRRCFT